MSFDAMNWAAEQRGLSHLEARVLMNLAYRLNDKTGRCNPSIDRQAGDAETDEKSVRRALVGLERKGAICRVMGGGAGKSTAYTLNLAQQLKGGLMPPFTEGRKDEAAVKKGGMTPAKGGPHAPRTKNRTTKVPFGPREARGATVDCIEQEAVDQSVPKAERPAPAEPAASGSDVGGTTAGATPSMPETAPPAATGSAVTGTNSPASTDAGLAEALEEARVATEAQHETNVKALEAKIVEAEAAIVTQHTDIATLEAQPRDCSALIPIHRGAIRRSEALIAELRTKIAAERENLAPRTREAQAEAKQRWEFKQHLAASPVKARLVVTQGANVSGVVIPLSGAGNLDMPRAAAERPLQAGLLLAVPNAQPKDADGAAPKPSKAVQPVWTEGLATLKRLGNWQDATARARLGQLRKLAYNDDALLMAAIREAAEQQPAEPFAWLRRAIEQRNQQPAAPQFDPKSDPWGINAWCEAHGARSLTEAERPAQYTNTRFLGEARWSLNDHYIDRLGRRVCKAASFDRTQAIDLNPLVEWLSTGKLRPTDIEKEVERVATWMREQGMKPHKLASFDKSVRKLAA